MKKFLIFALLALFTLSACSALSDRVQDGEGKEPVITVYRDPT